jgi:hypothetical protein
MAEIGQQQSLGAGFQFSRQRAFETRLVPLGSLAMARTFASRRDRRAELNAFLKVNSPKLVADYTVRFDRKAAIEQSH